MIKIKYINPREELKKRTGPSEKGPKMAPIPPNKIKSPPPIPSILLKILYKKLIKYRKL